MPSTGYTCTADNLKPVGPQPVAKGTDPTVPPLGRVVLREVGHYLRIQCQATVKEIVKRCTPWEWLKADKEWSVPLYWKEKLAADLREAGYEVQFGGTVVPARSRRPTLAECPGDHGCCKAPFRIGTPLPVTCSQCGERIERFHSYDPDQ